MSKKDKLISRLKTKPKDFTYNELKILLIFLGFKENNKGKTSGSRRSFYNENINCEIRLHKPHPNNILKPYQISDVLENLVKKGMI